MTGAFSVATSNVQLKFANVAHDRTSEARDALGKGVRWEGRVGICKITPAFAATDDTLSAPLCDATMFHLSRRNRENTAGHMAPFPVPLQCLLQPTLLGIVSKDGARQDHRARGYACLSQMTAIRHAWFQYYNSKIETGDTGRPLGVRSKLRLIASPSLSFSAFKFQKWYMIFYFFCTWPCHSVWCIP